MAESLLIALVICIQARLPAFLWGMPGVGKTAITYQIAEQLGWPLWTVILSIREPSDQGGLPVVTDQGVKMHPPMWAQQLADEGHGIVFFDEFNTAPPTVQSSALRVIHGGWAGDLKLPANTSFIAAGNPTTMSTGGYDLTSAIANRWIHFDWTMDPVKWADGMVSGFPAPPIVRLPEGWRELIPSKRALIAAYIRVNGDQLNALPEDPAEQGMAWSSPRTLDFLAQLLAASESVGHGVKSQVAKTLMRGAVGPGVEQGLSSYLAKLDLRDPEDYLKDPYNTPLPKRQDQMMATFDSVAAAALRDEGVKKQQRIERYYTAWKVLGRIMKTQSDIAIPAARVLAVNMPPEVDQNLPPEVEEMLPILEEANIDFSRASA